MKRSMFIASAIVSLSLLGSLWLAHSYRQATSQQQETKDDRATNDTPNLTRLAAASPSKPRIAIPMPSAAIIQTPTMDPHLFPLVALVVGQREEKDFHSRLTAFPQLGSQLSEDEKNILYTFW